MSTRWGIGDEAPPRLFWCACGRNSVDHEGQRCEPCTALVAADRMAKVYPDAAAEMIVRQARTIRRLRALADGYRDRCRELIKWATMGPHGLVQHGAAQERARIVARLREYRGLFDTAIDIIESEGSE